MQAGLALRCWAVNSSFTRGTWGNAQAGRRACRQSMEPRSPTSLASSGSVKLAVIFLESPSVGGQDQGSHEDGRGQGAGLPS